MSNVPPARSMRVGAESRCAPAHYNGARMSLRDAAPLRRQVALAIVGFSGLTVPTTAVSSLREFDLGGVILLRAQRRRARAGRRAVARGGAARRRNCRLWVSVDQEGGRVARLKAPFTEWPPMATLGRSGDVALAARFARRAGRRAAGRRHHARLRAGARRPHQSGESGHRRPRAGERAGRGRAPRARRSSRRCRAPGVAACGKHFPGHGDTPRRLAPRAAGSSSIRPIGCGRSSSCRSARRSRPACATIMTAHVLVPALDETGRRRCRRIVIGRCCASELGFDGVILSDDLEMKAVARALRCRRPPCVAIAAGCDGVLICSGDIDDAGGRARSARPRRRDGRSCPRARRRRARRQRRAKETVPGRADSPRRPVRGSQCGRPRPRRASGHRRRDGAIVRRMDCDQGRGGAPSLGPGNRIALVAPASPFDREEFDAGVAELRAPRASSRSTTSRSSRGAATSAGLRGDPRRGAAPTRGAIRRSPALIAVRGGYGSVAAAAAARRRAGCAATRRPLIGYSDLTSLLLC